MLLKIAGYVFSAFFVGFALVQFNDPDPFLWVTIYLLASVLSAVAASGRGYAWAYVGIALVYFVGTFLFWPTTFEGIGEQMQADRPFIEQGREALGLMVCGVAMLLAAWNVHRYPRVRPTL